MEILFENRYTMDRERFIYMFKNPGRIDIFPVLWVIFGLYFLFCAVVGAMNSSMPQFIYGAILLLLCCYMAFIRPGTCAEKTYTRLCGLHGGETWECSYRFGVDVMLTEGAESVKYDWAEISKIAENSKYYIIRVKRTTSIFLDKESFTVGSAADFISYVRKVHPYIPIIVK